MNRLQQQLLRLVVFAEQHGSLSDKLAAAEIRSELLPFVQEAGWPTRLQPSEVQVMRLHCEDDGEY